MVVKNFKLRREGSRNHITVLSAVLMTFTGILLLALCLSLLTPLVWNIIASLNDHLSYAIDPFSFPKVLHWENYSNVFKKLVITTSTKAGVVQFGLFDLVVHSVVYSVSIPLLGTLVTAVMGYVISKYRNPFSKFLYNFGIVLMIVPIIGSFPSSMQLNKALGRYDNIVLWIILSPAGCFSGMNFLLLYQLFRGMPSAYGDAARIDGAGHFSTMWKIYMPMALPLCAVIFVLSFLGTWNDYATPMIWLPSYPNLAYGTYIFQYQATAFRATQPEILAGFVITMIPSSILYLSMQKLIVEKMQIGGLKG